MLAEQYLKDGKIQEALEDLQAQIRKQPENSRYRIFYFQILSILGQWERALNQLSVIEQLDKDAWPMVRMYQSAIQSEVLRSEIFAGRQTPLIFGEPPQWMAWLLESLRLIADGQYPKAIELRNQAFDLAAARSGMLDEQRFEWIADADSRLGPVLEIIVNGRYFWAPFEQISLIRITEPADLRDLVWLPAQFVWVNGGEAVGLIPTRYPGSENADDPQILMARTTRWNQVHEEVYQGLGQRMLATDQDDFPVLDMRLIQMADIES